MNEQDILYNIGNTNELILNKGIIILNNNNAEYNIIINYNTDYPIP